MSPDEKKDSGQEPVDVFVTEQFQIIRKLLYLNILGYISVYCVVLNWQLHEESLKIVTF